MYSHQLYLISFFSPTAVSSLEEFKNTTDHYKASQYVDKDLFVQDTRPGCLTAVYDRASTDLKVSSLVCSLFISVPRQPKWMVRHHNLI